MSITLPGYLFTKSLCSTRQGRSDSLGFRKVVSPTSAAKLPLLIEVEIRSHSNPVLFFNAGIQTVLGSELVMRRFISNLDWALTPGPEQFTEPLFSTEVEEIAYYPPEAVTQALLSLPGVLLDHPNEPGWWEWRAHWEGSSGLIEFEMSILEPDDHHAFFGGFGLLADCPPPDFLTIWEALRITYPGIWLHSPDGEILKPRRFRQLYPIELPGSNAYD